MQNKLILLCLFCAAAALQPAAAQTKHALIFAIGKYPEKGGWKQLASNRDALLVRKALLRQGFAHGNINTLSDAAVTPQGIASALTQLTRRVKPGDRVLIHFSTHGEQVSDNNGDEVDGYDETIVTYHARVPKLVKNFEAGQQDYFRDDRFGKYIQALRSRLGKKGDVAVFMDLCHSGSGTRGTTGIRGGQPPLEEPGYRHAAKGNSGMFVEHTDPARESSLATYVVFSAAEAGGVSGETTDDNHQPVGLLSYALCKTLQTLESGTTYRTLFARVNKVISDKVPYQHPVWEGNGIDRGLFGGKFVLQKPYMEVAQLKGTQLTLRTGTLAGMGVGASVGVYPSGTTRPGKAPLAWGKVVRANSFTATVQLDKALSVKNPAALWVFIREAVFAVKPVSLKIARAFPNSAGIQQALSGNSLVAFTGTPELILSKGSGTDTLKTSKGDLFATLQDAAHNTGELDKCLMRYAQYKFLKGLEINDPRATVEVKMSRVVNRKAGTAQKIRNGTILKEGDSLLLRITNTGKIPVYVNVLDLQPDGVINPVLPYRKKQYFSYDLRIKPGGSFIRPIYNVSRPFGMEVIKVFVSPKEIDMENVVNLWKEGTRGADAVTIPEDFVKLWYEDGTRGAPGKNKAGGSIYSLLLQIRPR